MLSSSSYVATTLDSRLTSEKTPLLYQTEKKIAREYFERLNENIPSIIFGYLDGQNPKLTIEETAYLVMAEDILGTETLSKIPNTKKMYVEKVKELVLSIMCDPIRANDAPEIRAGYRQALDKNIEPIQGFNEAVHTLINTFIYDPICQGRVHHNNPLNAACDNHKWTSENYFLLFQQLLKIDGIDVNAYDALYQSNIWHSRKNTDNRLAPIHHLVDDCYSDTERDKKTVLYLKELLSHKADINLRTTITNDTALHIAANCCRPEVVRSLVSQPNIKLLLRNAEGKTPIDLARAASKGEGARKDETLQILEAALKHSHETGAKRTRLSHFSKKTLSNTSHAVGHAVAAPIRGVLGHFNPFPRLG